METTENYTIKYGADDVEIYRCNSLIYVDVKKICDNIGVNWPGQLKKIKESPKYLRGWLEIPTKENNGNKALCLDKKTFYLWLWSIEPERVKSSIQKTVVDYQENLDRNIDSFIESLIRKEVEQETSKKIENLEAIQEKIAISSKKIELIHKLNSLNPFSNNELFQIRNKILDSVIPGIDTKLQSPINNRIINTEDPKQEFTRSLGSNKTESNLGYL